MTSGYYSTSWFPSQKYKKNYETMMQYSSNLLQVVLQTYIEYLRGKIEEKKEMNNHGRTVVVDTGATITPVE